jgi:2-phosphosulfolactate phosphatase
MQQLVVIDCFAEGIKLHRAGYTIVAIDVIRATTTAVTVRARGQRCFAVASVEAAWELAKTLDHPLLVGEIAGTKPEGFALNNSPAGLAARADSSRPVILLSSSGTQLICEAAKCAETHLACFRNYSGAARVVRHHSRVAVIGAGNRGEFREEDQMCCAWVGAELIKSGFKAQDRRTAEIVARWSETPPSACLVSKSVTYLRRSGQLSDLDFILSHIDDLNAGFRVNGDEIEMLSPADSRDGEALEAAATRVSLTA